MQANLVPLAKFEPEKIDNLNNVQYSCLCSKIDGQVVSICARHCLEDLRKTFHKGFHRKLERD
jgi:hypothetical protein